VNRQIGVITVVFRTTWKNYWECGRLS